jgi:hypothetical protein
MRPLYREHSTIWQKIILDLRCRMNRKSKAEKLSAAGSFHGELLYFNEEHVRDLWQK